MPKKTAGQFQSERATKHTKPKLTSTVRRDEPPETPTMNSRIVMEHTLLKRYEYVYAFIYRSSPFHPPSSVTAGVAAADHSAAGACDVMREMPTIEAENTLRGTQSTLAIDVMRQVHMMRTTITTTKLQ